MPEVKAGTKPSDIKAKKVRSPSYPSFSLKDAVEKATLIYKFMNRSEGPEQVAYKAMGLSGTSGPSLSAMATLRLFGLIENVRGSGQVKLSQHAIQIVVDQQMTRPETLAAIRECAMKPSIHQQMWKDYGKDLPDDEALRIALKINHGFTPQGADAFVKEYRETFVYAQLAEQAKITPEPEDEVEKERGKDQTRQDIPPSTLAKSKPITPSLGAKPGMNQDTFTLDEGQVILQWPAKISPASYADLKDWLDLMSRRLKRAVAQEEPPLSLDPDKADPE